MILTDSRQKRALQAWTEFISKLIVRQSLIITCNRRTTSWAMK